MLAMVSAPSLASDNPVTVSGRIQAGLIANDNDSKNVFPTGFLNFDEGANLNRAEVLIEKKPVTPIKPRIGPFPGPKPASANWGFEVDLRYGRDAALTFGLDDELDINDGHKNLLLIPQWFATGYLPWGNGVAWIAGSWFTSVGYEIGAPVDPPSGFYSHSYAFTYAPTKHVGLLTSARLPQKKGAGMATLSVGIVQGWNNLQDNNDDKSIIFDWRWRSPDFRTWIDFENIIGNEQTDNTHSEQTRPFNAISSHNEKLLRRFHSLTVTHRFSPTNRIAFNMVYGFQEGGDVIAAKRNPPGFLIVKDSAWYGANFNLYHQLDKHLQAGLRLDWLTDAEGAHALLPAGDYYGITANLSWWQGKQLRIRPELRYDWYQGSGKPFGGKVPAIFFGETDSQWVASIDATWFLSP